VLDGLSPDRPHDIQAEQAVLGAAIQSPGALKTVLEGLSPADYFRPVHGALHALLGAMKAEGVPVDARTFTARAVSDGVLAADVAFNYVSILYNAVPTPGTVDWYMATVIDTAMRRGLIEEGMRSIQAGFSAGDGDGPELVEKAVTWFRELRDRNATTGAEAVDLHLFLAVEDHYDWLIPGLLERRDRLMLTASEGGGKTTLIRQLAICAAAGLHPFTRKPIDPLKVLILDLENSEAMTRRALNPLACKAAAAGRPIIPGMMSIRCNPSGLDITQQRDRAWVMREVEAFMPDVLIIGPVYRMHTGNPNDEELARKVSVVIDEARMTANCAVVMEAHSPHGNGMGPRSLRPLGSSLWMRWPEFGYGLRPVEDEESARHERAREFVPWRGARDVRDWPTHVKQGVEWPWDSYDPTLTGVVVPLRPNGTPAW